MYTVESLLDLAATKLNSRQADQMARQAYIRVQQPSRTDNIGLHVLLLKFTVYSSGALPCTHHRFVRTASLLTADTRYLDIPWIRTTPRCISGFNQKKCAKRPKKEQISWSLRLIEFLKLLRIIFTRSLASEPQSSTIPSCLGREHRCRIKKREIYPLRRLRRD